MTGTVQIILAIVAATALAFGLLTSGVAVVPTASFAASLWFGLLALTLR